MAAQPGTVHLDSSPSISPRSNCSTSPHLHPPTSRSGTVSPSSSAELFVIIPLKAFDGGRFVEELDIHGTLCQIDQPFHLEYIPKDTDDGRGGFGKHLWNKIVRVFKGPGGALTRESAAASRSKERA